jgi:glycosyltransferase involved in cell wall biosynthesis
VSMQDYPNVEHIVIDAASNDGTVDILRQRSAAIEQWISEPDKGIFDAWNKGVDLARGGWIAFLGSDDAYLAGAISRYMDLALKHPEAEFLTSRAELVHPSGYAPVFGTEWRWPACARELTTINVGTMHRRSLFEHYGLFDTSYRSAGDYEFLLRAGANLHTAFLPDATGKVRAGGASETTANLYERRRAKVSRGVRSPAAATRDLWLDVSKFHIRKAILTLWSSLRPSRPPTHQ